MSNRNPIDRATLGSCPRCKATIPESSLLIEYERKDRRAVFAHCDNCDHVVHPQ